MGNIVALTPLGVYLACSDSNVLPYFTDIIVHRCVYNNIKGIHNMLLLNGLVITCLHMYFNSIVSFCLSLKVR